MPGYGMLPAHEGTGLLPWTWAEQRLRDSHDYWLASVWPDGRPRVMPVWAVWLDGCLWISSSRQSRKARNLQANPDCVMTTDHVAEPVIVEGRAELVVDRARLADVLATENAKYSTDYGPELLDPAVNSSFRIVPRSAFGLITDDFTGSPTRWTFTST
jgi:nitroimidazol reductase NimA-like FMN-containing flavoprotein (pyridoxamine 5'-phosphate oxidase superfamily)